MKSKMFAIILVVFVSFSGCRFGGIRGSGDRSTEVRQIENFSYLDVSGAFDVRVKVGESPSLEISGDDNLLKYVRTDVRDDRLIIETKRNLRQREDIRIFVTVPKLRGIDISGANQVKIKEINTEEFKVGMSGACNVELDGKTKKLNIDISGASSLEADQFEAENVEIECSGASSAYVYASNSIEAEASGVSSIKYRGKPEHTHVHSSGVSSISRR